MMPAVPGDRLAFGEHAAVSTWELKLALTETLLGRLRYQAERVVAGSWPGKTRSGRDWRYLSGTDLQRFEPLDTRQY
jgi:hypothetical protein